MCQNMLQALKKSDNEEVECSYQEKDEAFNLVAVVEKSNCFYDKVVCAPYYLQSDSMTDVKEGYIESLSSRFEASMQRAGLMTVTAGGLVIVGVIASCVAGALTLEPVPQWV